MLPLKFASAALLIMRVHDAHTLLLRTPSHRPCVQYDVVGSTCVPMMSHLERHRSDGDNYSIAQNNINYNWLDCLEKYGSGLAADTALAAYLE